MEASRLRQKAEELVKDSELPPPPPAPSLGSFDPLTELTGTKKNSEPLPSRNLECRGPEPQKAYPSSYIPSSHAHVLATAPTEGQLYKGPHMTLVTQHS